MAGRRYLALDGIRGVAALAVFCMHSGAPINPIAMPHAYLAVDLFFLLSGYVIDHAYGNRLATGMTVRQFVLARYVRIYPLYFVGYAIGAAGAGVALFLGAGDFSRGEYAQVFVTGLLLLPSPATHTNSMLVPLNYPGWSLISEMLVNIIYAVTWRYWRMPFLPVLVVASGVWLVIWQQQAGWIGFGFSWDHAGLGLVRALFAFSCGVLLRRIWSGPARMTDWAYGLPVVVAVLLYGVTTGTYDWIIVVFVFPMIIFVAIVIEPKHERPFILLGTLSFPLYAIHVPIMQFIGRIATVLHVDLDAYSPWSGAAMMLIVVAAALALDRWYDVPVRRWLSQRLTSRPSRIDRGL